MQHDGGQRLPQEAANAALRTQDRPRFSICSVVNDAAQYAEMIQSFQAGGFTAVAGCEFLYLDNRSGNQYEPYSGYNLFLRVARGHYVILCHQDVFLIEDGFDRLNAVIEELDAIDPDWGLFGNSGGYWPCQMAIRIRDKIGDNQFRGAPLPRRCYSLDENFIVVRADANLALSKDLGGFHLYGTELCLVAAALGHHSYVVDFYLYHAGNAIIDKSYGRIRSAMIQKYSRASAPRMLRSPCSEMVFTPWPLLTWLANTRVGLRFSCFLSRALGRPPAPNRKPK